MTIKQNYFVKASVDERNLIVEATSGEDARDQWRNHFQLDAKANPTYVGKVKSNQTVDALAWGEVRSRN